jgi:hypothetical protein
LQPDDDLETAKDAAEKYVFSDRILWRSANVMEIKTRCLRSRQQGENHETDPDQV